MNLNALPQPRSLKTRVTLFTLFIFLIGIWSLALYGSRILREDMEVLLGDQQFSTVSILAEEVDHELNQRLRALEAIAASLAPATLGDRAALQALLEQRELLLQLFNAGVMVLGPDGTVIADVPRAAGRIGTNCMDFENISAALKEGKSTISRPVMGRKLLAPVFGMTAAIRDGEGRVIGALNGVTNLGKPNFLTKITDNSYGRTGGYFLVARQHRLIIAATDKSRVMQPLPAPGIIAMVDRAVQGEEGSAVFRNVAGEEVLASVKAVPAAGWYLAAALPTAEAFAPIRAMQQRMLVAAIFFTLLAGALLWWYLRHELSPLLTTARRLAGLSAQEHPLPPLPVTRQDEIGDLIGAFNRLLAKLGQGKAALMESEAFLASILDAMAAEVAVLDGEGTILAVNQAWRRFALENSGEPGKPSRYSEVGANYLAICAAGERSAADADAVNAGRGIRAVLDGSAPAFSMEYPCDSPQQQRWFSMSVTPLVIGERRAVVVHTDSTERRQAEAALRESEEQLKEAQHIAHVGSWTFDLRSGELIWSDEVFLMFEIDKSKFGATYEAFINAVHPEDRDAVSRAYADSLTARLPYDITHRLRTSDGRIKWVHEKCLSVFDAAGKPLRSLGTVQDITERRQSEAQRLADAQEQRNTLVREVHHRIKNNLQSVAGLLQRELGKFVELQPRLEAAVSQVHAIAIVHGLQAAEAKEEIRLCESLRNICRTASDLSGRPLQYEIRDEQNSFIAARIDRNEAVPVALVLNELVLNAVKHSPPDATVPTVTLVADGASALILIRNAVRQAPDFDIDTGRGLGTGLRLVLSLLPSDGTQLSYETDTEGCMLTRLTLTAPVVVATRDPEPG